MRHRLDLVGMLTSVGGGIARDVLVANRRGWKVPAARSD